MNAPTSCDVSPELTGDAGRRVHHFSPARFVARQPILDRSQRTFGYELLFRTTAESLFSTETSDTATKLLLDNVFLLGLDTVSDGHPVFMNCTRNILTGGMAALLPSERVVLEVLETVDPDDGVVQACVDLKAAGYRLALDDFTLAQFPHPLLPLADFVKVDFRLNTTGERGELARQLGSKGVHLVAEKVETQEDFEAALGMGYQYCQGFFFAKPKMMTARAVPAFKLNLLRIMREVCQPDFDASRLESAIKAETSVCFRLLNYLNTYAFSFRSEITSIRHALALLGESKVRQWLCLVVETAMGQDKPSELVVTCLIRARCCEQLAKSAGMPVFETDLFLTGMLSAIDAILDRPLEEILNELNVSHCIRSALIESQGPLHPLIAAVLALEKGDWGKMSEMTLRAHLRERDLMDVYAKSLEWAQTVFRM